MRILLLGASGQVGSELAPLLTPLGTLAAPSRAAFDLARPERLVALLDRLAPDAIVNAAAWTDVDGAEAQAALAHTVNADAPGALAAWAARHGAFLLHYSTDYVFDGRKATPYLEGDAPNPLNAYGRSKLAGEQAVAASGAAHLILRTGWVYRAGAHRNFLTGLLQRVEAGQALAAVVDQIGAPTWSRHLAQASAALLARWRHAPDSHISGVVHCTATGHTSRHGFALAVVEALYGAHAPPVQPARMADFPAPATRPANCRLDNGLLWQRYGLRLPDWQAGLRACLAAQRGDGPM